MYLDHPKITATNSESEPDRLERLWRVYGYAIAMADMDRNTLCIDKIAKLHDHRGTLMVIWHNAPTAREKQYFFRAWQSQIGDESTHVEHALMLEESVAAKEEQTSEGNN